MTQSATIPTFEWTDLDGKTLKIRVGENTENGIKVTSVMGQDVDTEKIYLLGTITKKVKPCNP